MSDRLAEIKAGTFRPDEKQWMIAEIEAVKRENQMIHSTNEKLQAEIKPLKAWAELCSGDRLPIGGFRTGAKAALARAKEVRGAKAKELSQ